MGSVVSMKEEITFRVAGERAWQAVRHLQPRPISDDIFEVRLPLQHPETRSLFAKDAMPCSDERNGWFITFPQIWRHYSESEYAASPLIHVYARRLFAEPMDDLHYYEY